MTVGETTVFNSSIVNAVRVAANRARVDNYQTTFFSPRDIGANLYSYLPGYMSLTVTGGFRLYTGTNTKALFLNDTYQVADDLTMVRGNHQFGFGANYIHSLMNSSAYTTTAGNFSFTAAATGLALGDFMLGKPNTYSQNGVNSYNFRGNYAGMYAQDTWKATSRIPDPRQPTPAAASTTSPIGTARLGKIAWLPPCFSWLRLT